MKTILNKAAATLAVAIGTAAIYSAGKALLGMQPSWRVLNWLPLYNYTVGVLTVAVSAYLLWRGGRLAFAAAFGTLGLHGTVMVILQTAFRDVVAAESVRTMTTRLIVWGAILALLLLQSLVSKRARRDDPAPAITA